MNDDQRFLMVGYYMFSALAIAGIFVAGVVDHNTLARDGAIVTSVLTALGYAAQAAASDRPSITLALVAASWVAGIVSAISLW